MSQPASNALLAMAANFRDMVTLLRRTSMPIADLVPFLQRAADTLDEIRAAHEPLPAPAPLERDEWTPQQALEFYAAGRHFDVVNGRTRILDTGAIASDALKQLSTEYAEMKGLSSPAATPRCSDGGVHHLDAAGSDGEHCTRCHFTRPCACQTEGGRFHEPR